MPPDDQLTFAARQCGQIRSKSGATRVPQRALLYPSVGQQRIYWSGYRPRQPEALHPGSNICPPAPCAKTVRDLWPTWIW